MVVYTYTYWKKACIHIFFNWYSGEWIQGPLSTAATNRPIVPAPDDYDDGEIGGMIGRGNRSTRRKPAPVPLCPPQTPHAARTRTRAAAVGSQRLTAWATARPMYPPCFWFHFLCVWYYEHLLHYRCLHHHSVYTLLYLCFSKTLLIAETTSRKMRGWLKNKNLEMLWKESART
jgi:hypothetical protein